MIDSYDTEPGLDRDRDHPAYIAGYDAAMEGRQQFENPHHPVREHEAHAQWRNGWVKADEVQEEWFVETIDDE